jgi:hypothetical protein
MGPPVDQQIQKNALVGEQTTDYFISDFKINELPEENPLQNIIDDFAYRRAAHVNKRMSANHTSSKNSQQALSINGQSTSAKPKLAEFLSAFEDQVVQYNSIYRRSKQ